MTDFRGTTCACLWVKFVIGRDDVECRESAVTRPSSLENQLDEMDENDNDFEVLEVQFTDEETEEFEETDEWWARSVLYLPQVATKLVATGRPF